jgi:hypothetical protein
VAPDLDEFLARSTPEVCPLRYGRMLKTKAYCSPPCRALISIVPRAFR